MYICRLRVTCGRALKYRMCITPLVREATSLRAALCDVDYWLVDVVAKCDCNGSQRNSYSPSDANHDTFARAESTSRIRAQVIPLHARDQLTSDYAGAVSATISLAISSKAVLTPSRFSADMCLPVFGWRPPCAALTYLLITCWLTSKPSVTAAGQNEAWHDVSIASTHNISSG